MLVKDLMNKNVVYCEPDEQISQALSKMKKYKLHQLPVLENKGLSGILVLNNIITKDVDPNITKVSTLMSPAPKINPNATIEEATELILGTNLRAIPVFDSKLEGMLSEQDLMKAANIKEKINIEMCCYVESDDNVGKVKNLMVHKNVSRVPVVKNGNFIGIVGTLDLIKVLEGEKRFEARAGRMRDSGYKEGHRINLNKTSVSSIMRDPIVLKKDYNINEIIRLLQRYEEVLVENGVFGIITPKDILRLMTKPKKFSYVQITGVEDESSLTVDKMYQSASELIQRLSKSVELQPMKIHIKKHKKFGPKTKYSLHLELPTAIGTFFSTKTYGLGKTYSDIPTLTQKAMDKLEREIRKKLEKSRRTGRRRISSKRMGKE